jgi:hypothetical protein
MASVETRASSRKDKLKDGRHGVQRQGEAHNSAGSSVKRYELLVQVLCWMRLVEKIATVILPAAASA